MLVPPFGGLLVERSNRTFMELKYILKGGIIKAPERSNRTFMELKLNRVRANNHRSIVLIAPFWN